MEWKKRKKSMGKKAIDDILAISRATSADRGYRTRTEQWWQVAETPPVGWRPFGRQPNSALKRKEEDIKLHVLVRLRKIVETRGIGRI